MDDIIIQKSSTENLAHYLNQEWLETNQLGGYASSSILNCHTRKYHGLLTVEIPTHTEKQLLLSQLEEEITLDHQTYPLSFFGYRNCYFHGRGFDYFTEFKQSIFPEFIYQCDSHRITRKLMMLNHQNTVLVRYDIERTGADLIHPEINANGNKNSEALFQMKIRPLFAMRNFHGVQKLQAIYSVSL